MAHGKMSRMLDKVKRPEMEPSDEMASMHDEESETPEEELSERPEMQEREEKEGTEQPSPELEKFTDEELMAELRRRGLEAELDHSQSEAPPESHSSDHDSEPPHPAPYS